MTPANQSAITAENLALPVSSSHPFPGLRVGVLLDSEEVPRWIQEVLRQLRAADFVDPIALVTNRKVQPPPLWKAVVTGWHAALFTLWSYWDYRHFKARHDDAFASVRLDGEVPSVSLGPPEMAPEDLVRRLRDEHLDVLIDFSSISATGLSHCARHGVWSFEQMGNGYEPVPENFRDLHHSRAMAEIVQLRIRERCGQRLISHSSRVDPISLFRNQNAACWKLARFAVRQLSELHQLGYYGQPLTLVSERHALPPGNLEMMRFLVRWVARGISNKIQTRSLRESWFIAYRNKTDAGTSGFKVIMPPRDRFYADPFLCRRQGKNFIFFEDYRYTAGKAVISCVEIDAAGGCYVPEVVLDREYHLSYPFIFDWQGHTYMLPETAENRTIELYRATDFPRAWVLDRVLMKDVDLVDPTLLEHEGLWWLFACQRGGNDELLLFYAESPFGPWMPHPLNPVVSGVDSVRPAGRFFLQNGQLIRPSQDCSIAYGYSIVLNRVDELSVLAYRETPIAQITPEWYPGNRGTHTVDENESLQVLDGRVLTGWPGALASSKRLNFLRRKPEEASAR